MVFSCGNKKYEKFYRQRFMYFHKSIQTVIPLKAILNYENYGGYSTVKKNILCVTTQRYSKSTGFFKLTS
jgi:hypothetical protein